MLCVWCVSFVYVSDECVVMSVVEMFVGVLFVVCVYLFVFLMSLC